MLDIQRRTIDSLAKMLDKWEILYKILLPNGEELGTLIVSKQTKTKRADRPHPFGAFKAYFLPLVQDMVAGDVVEIHCGPFKPAELRGAVSAWAVAAWGKGSVTTHINSEKQTVEVLRLTDGA